MPSRVFAQTIANWGLQSFLGRIAYTFKDKYLLTAHYGDGSSKFQTTENKWGYFPSISAGWRLSEEDFIKTWMYSPILNFVQAGALQVTRVSLHTVHWDY
jgi:hypothetical protein